MDIENKNDYEEMVVDEPIADIAVASSAPRRSRKKNPDIRELILPGSILIAAIIIAGSLFYTRGSGYQNNNPGTGTPGNTQAPSGPVNVSVTDNDHILGNKNAKVTIVEFADFRCPFCEKFYQQVEKQLVKDYVNTGKVRFVFKNYAFLGQQSIWASEAAECANEQGKYWQYHDWLYDNQAPESDLAFYSKANLTKYAAKVGLNTTQFSSCLNSDKYSKRVADDLAEGQKDGVTGTPTAFINGQKIVGAQPFATFQTVIDGLLKK